MKINEVMKETGLTKKAIYYYENEGLIKPKKDPDNNYRDYTDADVRRLLIINILRRLDVPIKAIRDIIKNSVPVKEVLREQLVLTNQKINLLFQNKKIMNELIIKDINEHDFSYTTLKNFNREMDNTAIGLGPAEKELEMIFPGTLGKILAIFYSNYLNIPLDSDEKISAWNDLINKLDEMKEIDFPEDIQNTVDELYDEIDDDKLACWRRISKRLFDEMIERQMPPDHSGILMTKEALIGYYANPDNQKKIEGYYRLQSFIINNLEIFMEVDKYISIMSSEYNRYKHFT